jgi:hypothetical protein
METCTLNCHIKLNVTGNQNTSMRDSRLPPQCKYDLRCFGIPLSVEWYFLTDVSGKPIFPSSKIKTASPLKMEPIGCPETSVRKYHSTLSKIQE